MSHSIFLRLMWKEYRLQRAFWIAMVVLAVLFQLIVLGFMDVEDAAFKTMWLFDVALAPPLAGACVFLGDQRRRGFRFLAERGVGPGYVWLSRHLIWMVPTVVCTILVSAAALPPEAWAAPSALMLGRYVGTVLGFVILAYSSGQLFSKFFSSGILAAVFSVALAVLLYFWAGVTMLLDVPWVWSVVPIPLVLLLATSCGRRTGSWSGTRYGRGSPPRLRWPCRWA